MKKTKLSLYLLTVFFIATSCSAKKAIPEQDFTSDKISRPWIFSESFKESLYKSTLSIYNREITGLMFFKKTEKSIRVVLLSELGMKYFDIELFTDQNSFTTHYLVDFLNIPKVTSSFHQLFQMLFVNFPEIKEDFTFRCDGSGEMIRVIKTPGKKYSYRYVSQSGMVQEIFRHKFLKENTGIRLSNYGLDSPGKIDFMDNKINISLLKINK